MKINEKLALFFILMICSIDQTSAQSKVPTHIFDSLIATNKSIQLIDVRTPAEVATGTIKGSQNIDYSSPDFIQKIGELDKSKPIAVYCALGGRSGKAALKLKELGFTQIYDLAGGLTEWKAKNKPIALAAQH